MQARMDISFHLGVGERTVSQLTRYHLLFLVTQTGQLSFLTSPLRKRPKGIYKSIRTLASLSPRAGLWTRRAVQAMIPMISMEPLAGRYYLSAVRRVIADMR